MKNFNRFKGHIMKNIYALFIFSLGSSALLNYAADQNEKKDIPQVQAPEKKVAGQRPSREEELAMWELIQRTMGTPEKTYYVESPNQMHDILLERCGILQPDGSYIHPE